MRFVMRLNTALSRYFPEQRVYLRTDRMTRYFRATPLFQVWAGGMISVLVVWMLIATSALMMNRISTQSENTRADVLQRTYETRLAELFAKLDQRTLEAQTAQQRFYVALEQISMQQSESLQAEEERRELETGLMIMQEKLQKAMAERDAAQGRSDSIPADIQNRIGSLETRLGSAEDMEDMLETLARALDDTVRQRDELEKIADDLVTRISEMEYGQRLAAQRNAQVYARLESAINVTLGPLERALRRSGIDTESLIEEMRKTYVGTGGPKGVLSVSTRDASILESNSSTRRIFERLDRVAVTSMAVKNLPLAFPVRGAYRHTSGFGYRRDPKTGGIRFHSGTDLAGARGTPIVATGDGVVSFAGRQGAYGMLVKIRHAQGFETFYAHLNAVRVKKGQRVSHGDRIGDMGASGRSTGVHLHYEVHLNGKALNPAKFMKAANDVF
ncbi:MAG: peptidoglycan DD-metalloendopeptidase family protein [Rhodobacteraceae bacterium]|nr:peptidoglycan DD-metalloendopeptidase family protein [Paracoccaceae bacterium]